MPQLDPSSFSSQIFWLLITFGLMYLFMARMAIPSVGKVLRNRQDRIQKDIEQAEKLNHEAKELKAEYEKSLEITRRKAHNLIAVAHDKAAATAKERHAELDAKVADKLAAADATLQETQQKAEQAFKPVAKELSQLIVKKLIDKDVQDESVTQKVDALMKELKDVA